MNNNIDLKEIIFNNIKTDWKNILINNELDNISIFLNKEQNYYKNDIKIFPPNNLIFNSFNFRNINDTNVIILGQDPYINIGEAMGLSFSVPNGIKVPPSLRNIKKEISSDIGIELSENGDLTNWAKQGVLLLNTSLTVLQYKSNSHKKIWKKYTDNIIKLISNELENIVFILWGGNAKNKKKLINKNKGHLILEAHHPSPLSANRGGFFGCKHFSKTNEYLISLGKKPINWEI